MPETNITLDHRNAFNALTSGEFSNFTLFSCFVDGVPTSAICAVVRNEAEYTIQPLFVAVTPNMVLTDYEGAEAVS